MFQYEEINIHYTYTNNNHDKTIIYLHGWGQNIEMMEPIAKPLEKEVDTLILDLPGFGKSGEPKSVWSLEDYADMVHALVEKLKIKKTIMVGHSFGGKVSIVYASKYKVEKLILLASPYKVAIPKVSLKVRILKRLAKLPLLKNIANQMKKNMGSTDYKNASPKMRSILVKHINTDVSELCKDIKCPTLIIWGTKDEAVPLIDAYELEKLISNSAVIEYPGLTHYAYLEDLNKTIRVIKSFII